MSVTTRIVAGDDIAPDFTFIIEHEGQTLKLGPAAAHELATLMEAELRELVGQLGVAERMEAHRLSEGRGPSSASGGDAPSGDGPDGGPH